jgi:pimeloyl-ACP methyl ester carboxylesterase
MLPQQAAVSSAMAEQMKETPMYKTYAAIAPRPQDFPRLLDAMGAYMRAPYNWSESVKKLTMPVMLAYGDADMIRPEHIVEFYKLLGGGLKDAGWTREHMSQNRLAILPNLTHYEVGAAPILALNTRRHSVTVASISRLSLSRTDERNRLGGYPRKLSFSP